MTDVPERIWVMAEFAAILSTERGRYVSTDTEYTRSDLITALLAAERKKALEEAAGRVDDIDAEWSKGTPYIDRDEAVSAIRALIAEEKAQ